MTTCDQLVLTQIKCDTVTMEDQEKKITNIELKDVIRDSGLVIFKQ